MKLLGSAAHPPASLGGGKAGGVKRFKCALRVRGGHVQESGGTSGRGPPMLFQDSSPLVGTESWRILTGSCLVP